MFSPRSSKIFRDLWEYRGRSILVILAITIGVIGVGTILFAYSILLRELDKNYMMTNPASASIYVEKVDADLINLINDSSGIKTSEIRGFYKARLQISDDVWKSIRLFVVSDFNNQKLNKFTIEKGACAFSGDKLFKTCGIYAQL